MARRTAAVSSSSLAGMHPTWRQVPPTFAFSTMAMFEPGGRAVQRGGVAGRPATDDDDVVVLGRGDHLLDVNRSSLPIRADAANRLGRRSRGTSGGPATPHPGHAHCCGSRGLGRLVGVGLRARRRRRKPAPAVRLAVIAADRARLGRYRCGVGGVSAHRAPLSAGS